MGFNKKENTQEVLAHTIGNAVEAAYRRDVMERWGVYLAGGNVVPLLKEA